MGITGVILPLLSGVMGSIGSLLSTGDGAHLLAPFSTGQRCVQSSVGL